MGWFKNIFSLGKSNKKNKNTQKQDENSQELSSKASQIGSTSLKNVDILISACPGSIENLAENQDLPERPSSPVKRAINKIKKRGYFGTIRRVTRVFSGHQNKAADNDEKSSTFERLKRKLSLKRNTRATIATTELRDNEVALQNSTLVINSTQSTPLKPTRKLADDNRAHSAMDISEEVILESENFNETIDEYTLQAVVSTGQQILDNSATYETPEPARDILEEEIRYIAKDIVENTLVSAFTEVQKISDEAEEIVRLGRLEGIEEKQNASLEEDQYSGQLSSRNNTPAKIRKLSENQQIFDTGFDLNVSPLVKNEKFDSDVESTENVSKSIRKSENERFPKMFSPVAKKIDAVEANDTVVSTKNVDTSDKSHLTLESTETVGSTSKIQSRDSNVITPAIIPEQVNVLDISNWSQDEARELINRPSVRQNIEETTLDARRVDGVKAVNDNLELLSLLKEQYVAKEKIYQEVLNLSIDELGKVNQENNNDLPISKTSSITEQNKRTSTTSSGTIKAPYTTIETYLPTYISSDSMAAQINEANEMVEPRDSTTSVSKTSQESSSSNTSKDSDQTIGRRMRRNDDMRSITIAKERDANKDSRVIVSQTTQNEQNKKLKKDGGNTKNTAAGKTTTKPIHVDVAKITADTITRPPAESLKVDDLKLDESKYTTPKVNQKVKDNLEDSQVYETPVGGKVLQLDSNNTLSSVDRQRSNISESTDGGRATPTMRSSPKRDGKGRRQNRKRNKGGKHKSKVSAN